MVSGAGIGLLGGTSVQPPASTLQLNDCVQLQFGDCSDSVIYFNNADTIWDLQAVGTGGLTIALGDSFPAPDNDTIHIWSGTAGAVTSIAGTHLTIESASAAYISFLVPNSVSGVAGMYVGTSSSNETGAIRYNVDGNRWEFFVNAGANGLFLTALGNLEFQQASTISNTTGDLILDPTASLNVTLTVDDADAFDLSNDNSTYYLIDTRNTAAGVFAHLIDTEDAVLADAATAVYGLVQFAAHSVTLAGTTGVTTRGITVDMAPQTIVASGGAVTVNDWDTLRVVAPTESTDVTLTDAVAIHIINAGGTPTNQYGLLIDDLTAGGTDIGLQWTGHLIYSDAAFAFQEATTISTSTGTLTIDSAGETQFNAKNIVDISELRGNAGGDLTIRANKFLSNSTARRVQIETIDTVGNAAIPVSYAVPTATGTTPFWAQRGDVTTPLTSTLDASFLTFRWNPCDDAVTVFVNDGGTIRSVSIGTVV